MRETRLETMPNGFYFRGTLTTRENIDYAMVTLMITNNTNMSSEILSRVLDKIIIEKNAQILLSPHVHVSYSVYDVSDVFSISIKLTYPSEDIDVTDIQKEFRRVIDDICNTKIHSVVLKHKDAYDNTSNVIDCGLAIRLEDVYITAETQDEANCLYKYLFDKFSK